MKEGKFIPAGKKRGTVVQSIIIDKDKFKTEKSAKEKVRELGFKISKVDRTENKRRFRQFDPDKCKQGRFATIELTDGVQAVICEPK